MIMNLHYVVQVLLWGVCVCDISNNVKIIANQTTYNPDDCVTAKCPAGPGLCSRAIFSLKDSTCLFLNCDTDVSCDVFLQEQGKKPQNEEPGADPHQPSSGSSESPVSPSQTAPPAALPPSAAPATLPVPPPAPDGQQRSDTGNASASSSASNTRTSSQPADQEKVLNQTLQHGDQTKVQTTSSKDEDQGQNKTLDNGHQGQPSVTPSAPAPTSPPLPVASVGAGDVSSTVPQDQNKTQVNKTDQHSISTSTTTTTTISTTTSTSSSSSSSDKPALPTNTTTSTTITTATVTSTTTTTTNNVTSVPPTTHTSPTSTTPSSSTPPTSPPSTAPLFLPSVTPRPTTTTTTTITTPGVSNVTSDQDKAIVENAGGALDGHLVNTTSLIAVLTFGLLFFIVTVILFLRHAYESYKRRGYTQMDYLINGMYSDSGL